MAKKHAQMFQTDILMTLFIVTILPVPVSSQTLSAQRAPGLVILKILLANFFTIESAAHLPLEDVEIQQYLQENPLFKQIGMAFNGLVGN